MENYLNYVKIIILSYHNRRLSVYYDYKEKRARADIEEGYEAAKYYIRRYDNKNEYMIRLPPIDDCKRSYLGEVMPYPDMSEAVYKGIKIVNLRECNYYIVENFNTRVHIYMDYEDGYIQIVMNKLKLSKYEFCVARPESQDYLHACTP